MQILLLDRRAAHAVNLPDYIAKLQPSLTLVAGMLLVVRLLHHEVRVAHSLGQRAKVLLSIAELGE